MRVIAPLELNMLLAVALLLIVFALGPTVFLLSGLFTKRAEAASELVALTFRQFAYQPNEWLGLDPFYWAWWMAWAPFVRMFMLRVFPRAGPLGSSWWGCFSPHPFLSFSG